MFHYGNHFSEFLLSRAFVRLAASAAMEVRYPSELQTTRSHPRLHRDALEIHEKFMGNQWELDSKAEVLCFKDPAPHRDIRWMVAIPCTIQRMVESL